MQQVSSTISCPNCAEPLQATALFCRFCHRGLSTLHYKKCSHCAEMVRRTASRCRFCRSDLSELSEILTPTECAVPRVSVNP